MTATRAPAAGTIRLRSVAGRWVLLAAVLGSGLVMLDATVVNVALPTIGKDFGAGLSSLQWTVNAYTLTLAGLLLLGGSLGDHYGRRRAFATGIVWFAVASLLCGVAPSIQALVAARALQGVGAALLTPGSLAIIEAVFHPDDRAAAVGAWSGLGGVTTAVGPVLGGFLTMAASWRWIFLLNLPFTVTALWAAIRHVPESRDPRAAPGVDFPGATLAALGLAGVIYALTEAQDAGWADSAVLVAGIGGVLALAAFLLVERGSAHPMLPLEVFGSRQFSATNLVTFIVYGALGGALFLLPIQLQRVLGLTPLWSGTALVPITVVLLLLSARAGRLAQRIGPRLPMTVGPLLAAAGLALLVRVVPGSTYWSGTLPGVLVFALGMSLTVAPLTATVLAAVPDEHAGVASAVNNDVARAAGLVAVATLPAAAGISGGAALDPATFAAGFRTAMWLAASLVAAGGLLAWATVRNPSAEAAAAADAACHPGGPASTCPLDAPPLRRPALSSPERGQAGP
jgi:EmrB/QacA subfamily drug resistance transporter